MSFCSGKSFRKSEYLRISFRGRYAEIFDLFWGRFLFYRNKLAAVGEGDSFSVKAAVSAVGSAVIDSVTVGNDVRERAVGVDDSCNIAVGGDVPL